MPPRIPPAPLGPLMACVGGIYDGQWFTVAEWEHRLRATTRMQEFHPGRTAPALQYQRTTKTARHPHNPDDHRMEGQVWTTR